MKRFFSIWNGLAAKDKKSLTILTVFLSVMVGYLGVIEPVYKQFEALSSQKQTLELKKQKNSSGARTLARREAKLAESRTEYNYLLDKLDVENTGAHTLVEVINEIKNFSAKIDVTIDQIRPMQIKDMGFHQEMPLEITLRGAFEPFRKFVYYLETSPQIFAISDVNITREERGISARLMVSKISLENVAALSNAHAQAAIRIGLELWPGYAPFYIAEHKGWLEKKGMSVKLVHGTDNGKMVRLLETRDLDGVGLSLGNLIENLEKGLDIKAVYPLSWTRGAEAVVAGVGSSIRQVADLKGKTVYTSDRVAQYLLYRAMELNGMNLHQLRMETLNSRMISQSLTTGMVEAGVILDPYLSQLTGEKKARIIFSSEKIPGEIMENLVVQGSLLDDDRKEVVSFLIQVLQKAMDWVVKNPEEASTIVAKRMNMAPKAVSHGLEKIHFPTRAEVKEIIGFSKKENRMDHFIQLQERFLSALYGKKVDIPQGILTDWSMAVEVLASEPDKTEEKR
jgi:NitT/TauT family transport system substrate-binding protein